MCQQGYWAFPGGEEETRGGRASLLLLRHLVSTQGALHPLDSKARLLVRSMRRAIDRHKALSTHTGTQQNFQSEAGPKFTRVRKNQVAPAPPAPPVPAQGPLDLTGAADNS